MNHLLLPPATKGAATSVNKLPRNLRLDTFSLFNNSKPAAITILPSINPIAAPLIPLAAIIAAS